MSARNDLDSGQVTVIVTVSMLGLLAITALVIDGGLLFATKRNLQSLSDAAARAGAMRLDEQALREGQDQLMIHPGEAEAAASSYLDTAGFHGEFNVTANPSTIRVRLKEEHASILLGIVGIERFEMRAASVARPAVGTTREGE
jgi:hypothetical protein